MLHWFRPSFGNSFSSRRNGGLALEEAEEGERDQHVVRVKERPEVPQEKPLDAKDLAATALVKFNP